jgi:hypothetical protein
MENYFKAENIIKKITHFHYFLFMISVLLFVDDYLMISYKTSLEHIDKIWISKLNPFDFILFVIFLGLFYAVINPFLNIMFIWLNDLRIIQFGEKQYEKYTHRMNEVKNYAVINNNSVAYKEFERSLEERARRKQLDRIVFAMTLLGGVNITIAIIYKQGMIMFVYLLLVQSNRFIQSLLLFFIPFCMIYLISILIRDRDSDEYVYFGSRQVDEVLKEFQMKEYK